jgi:O-antigen ligase
MLEISKNKINKLKYNMLSLLIFLTFTFPRILSDLKFVILILLLSLNFLTKSNSLSKSFYKIILLYLLLFLIPLLVGLTLGNDFHLILQSFKLSFFYPILFLLILIAINNNHLYKILNITAFYSLLVSFLINASTFLFFIGYFPFNLNRFFYPGEDIIGLNNGYVHIINSSFSFWIFTIPLYFCVKTNKSVFDSLLLLSLFILAILSGRRILLLPFIFVAFFKFNSFKKLFVLTTFFLVLLKLNIFATYIDLDTVLQRFNDAIFSSGDSEVRGEQRQYFLSYIIKSPLWGYGLGAFMNDFLRNDTFKTAYENTYDYLIFERGIIFGFLTILYFIWLLYKVQKNKLSDGEINPILFATICLLLASYTNPYWLSSFDYVLPLALIMKFALKKEYL